MSPSSADRFVEATRSYLGVRWRHMGRNRHGVDCVGLLLCAARDIGMASPEPPPYARGHRGPQLLDALRIIGRQIPITERRIGDVLAFRDVRFTAHVGLLSWKLDREHVINARADLGHVVEEPLIGVAWDKVVAAIRPPELED